MNLITEALPFSVGAITSQGIINRIAAQRSVEYRSHYGEFALSLQNPEPEDTHPHALLVAAISTEDSRILGSFRLEKDSLVDVKISIIEKHGQFKISGKSALVSRLFVSKTIDQVKVRNALFKFLHRYCFSAQIQNILVAAKPPLDKIYERLGFKPALDFDQLIPNEWSGNHKTRIMYLDTVEVVVNWHRSRHHMYDFMANTFHPNVNINP